MTEHDLIKVQSNTAAAEQSVIGAVLLDNNVMNEIDLTPEHFWLTNCALIFDAMVTLHRERKPIDIITLSDYISNTRNVDLMAEIGEYNRSTPSARGAKTYAEKVKAYWRSRQAVRIAHELMDIQQDNNQNHIDAAISQLMSLNVTAKNHNHNIATTLDAALSDIQAAMSCDGTLGFKTGMSGIDEVTGGLHKTDLIVVAARPAMGKTAMMLNMLTINPDLRAGFMSSEQGHNQIGMRLLSIHGSVNGARMRKGDLDDTEFAKISGATGKLHDRCIWVNDKPSMSIEDIERQARQWVHDNGVNVIGVDYIQKIRHSNSRLNTIERITDVVTRLKELAKELNIPVVALAQVNRKVEDRADKRPGMSDIKDCGVVEQEADQVICLYRDEVYHENTQDRGIAEIIYCKNRHGPIGTQRMIWESKYMQFNNLPYHGY